VNRIVASVAAGNERGLKLVRRLGFRVEPNQQSDPESGTNVPGSIGFLDAPGR
jgi:RimJ/RimL family protein N-acetyltransferase